MHTELERRPEKRGSQNRKREQKAYQKKRGRMTGRKKTVKQQHVKIGGWRGNTPNQRGGEGKKASQEN